MFRPGIAGNTVGICLFISVMFTLRLLCFNFISVATINIIFSLQFIPLSQHLYIIKKLFQNKFMPIL